MAETTKSEVKHLGIKGLIRESSDKVSSKEHTGAKSVTHGGGYGGSKPKDVGKKDSKPVASGKGSPASPGKGQAPAPGKKKP